MSLLMRLFLPILWLGAAVISSLYGEEAHFGWAKSLGHMAASDAALAADSAGNVFSIYRQAVGETATDKWLIKKVDSSGMVLWTNALQTGASISAAATNPQGDCYITGYAPSGAFANAPVVPQGTGNIFIAKFRASGGLDWIHLEGAAQNFSALTVDAQGNLHLLGYYAHNATIGGVALPTTSESEDGRMFLAKYSGDSSLLWVQTAIAFPGCLAADAAGNIYVSFNQLDYSEGSVVLGSASVAKYDPRGNVTWAIQTPLSGYPSRVRADRNGNVYLLTSVGGGISITKWSSEGALMWEQQFILPYLRGDDLEVDAQGNCLVALRYNYSGSPATFGQTTFTTTAEFELAILKFNPSGDLRWAISSTSIYTPNYQNPGVNNPTTSDVREAHLASSPNGACWVTARMKGTIQFGPSKVVGPNYNGGDVALLATIVDPELVVATPPSLQILRSGNGLNLSWPDSAAGFILESAGSLGGTGAWSPVTNPATSSGGTTSVQLDRPGQSAFYRLKKP